MSRSRHTDIEKARIIRELGNHHGSTADFCRQRGISSQTFTNWRRRAEASVVSKEDPPGDADAPEEGVQSTGSQNPRPWPVARHANLLRRRLPRALPGELAPAHRIESIRTANARILTVFCPGSWVATRNEADFAPDNP
jgi:hypothetical protein